MSCQMLKIGLVIRSNEYTFNWVQRVTYNREGHSFQIFVARFFNCFTLFLFVTKYFRRLYMLYCYLGDWFSSWWPQIRSSINHEMQDLRHYVYYFFEDISLDNTINMSMISWTTELKHWEDWFKEFDFTK